jgi:hypothetical protein
MMCSPIVSQVVLAPARSDRCAAAPGANPRELVRTTLWKAADELRANSTLAPTEYRGPVLGLIFLAYAEHRFDQVGPSPDAGSPFC